MLHEITEKSKVRIVPMENQWITKIQMTTANTVVLNINCKTSQIHLKGIIICRFCKNVTSFIKLLFVRDMPAYIVNSAEQSFANTVTLLYRIWKFSNCTHECRYIRRVWKLRITKMGYFFY